MKVDRQTAGQVIKHGLAEILSGGESFLNLIHKNRIEIFRAEIRKDLFLPLLFETLTEEGRRKD